MKQQITEKDWNSLSFKAKEQLIKWTTSKGYPDLLSVGQMIEFIDWHLHFPKIIIDEDICCDHCPVRYNLEFYLKPDKASRKLKRWSVIKDELCDALWEGVKDILNHEN